MKNNSLNQEQATPAVTQTQPTAEAMRAPSQWRNVRELALRSLEHLPAASQATGNNLRVIVSMADAEIDRETGVAELVSALTDTLALARIKWGNLDPDANKVFENARAVLARHANGGAS